jgi:hypothetical protein
MTHQAASPTPAPAGKTFRPSPSQMTTTASGALLNVCATISSGRTSIWKLTSPAPWWASPTGMTSHANRALHVPPHGSFRASFSAVCAATAARHSTLPIQSVSNNFSPLRGLVLGDLRIHLEVLDSQRALTAAGTARRISPHQSGPMVTPLAASLSFHTVNWSDSSAWVIFDWLSP